MSLITPPATMPLKRIEWRLKQPHQVNRSGWTGRRQVLATPGGAVWSCSAEFVPIIGQAAAKKWQGFFHSLEGQVHRFPVVAVEADQHQGVNPTVVTSAAGAFTAQLSNNIAGLGLGDKMTFKLADGNYQMVSLTGPMSGSTVAFVPALRGALATGSGSCETIRPFAIMALPDDSWGYQVGQGQQYGFAFSAEEAF